MWVEENWFDTALQEIPTEIERKQAQTYRPIVEEVEEQQQRKHGRGIDGCLNFARKDTRYVRAGKGLRYVPFVVVKQNIQSWEFEGVQIAEDLQILFR